MRDAAYHINWRTILDNHTPTRGHACGMGTAYAATETQAETLVISPVPEAFFGASFMVDDGSTVVPMYAAGWSRDASELYLNTMPVSGGIRPDGRPVDMSGWVLGPRKCFHLKIVRIAL